MKKKLLSILTASAMAVSAAAALQLSAAAFTLNSTYDEVKIDNKFNTESNTGAPDGTAYKISDGTDTIWNTSSGITVNNANYYFSVDFKVGDATGTLIKMTNSNSNVGPQLSLSGNTLRNQTSSSGYADLYKSFDTSKWYKIEFEGRMKAGSATNYTLYEYNNSTATQVASGNIYLRNFDNANNYGYTTLASGVSYDNEYAVQEWPDEVKISQEDNITELTAGQSAQFTAAALRAGTSDNITQPNITWSISGMNAGEESYFSIDGGRLTVNSQASEQTIKITATAPTLHNPNDEYIIKINSINIDDEKFDTITVTGPASLNAGSSTEYTYTASKNGADVTSSLTADDVAWSVVDSTGSRVLGNKYITASNGILTVDSSILGQNICVRASTADGFVYGDCPVTINTVSKESVVNANACEEKFENNVATVVQGSWDGSSYYMKNTSGDFLGSGTLGTNTVNGDILITADVKFADNGSGFTTMRRDNGEGLWLKRYDGVLAVQTGGNSYRKLGDSNNGGKGTYTIDTNSWYHVEIMFYTYDSSINIWQYDSEGNKINKSTFTKEDGFVFRSTDNKGFNRIRLEGNIGIDNYLVVYPHADSITVIPDDDTVAAGSSINASVTGIRDGLRMYGLSNSAVNWAIYDSNNNLPIEGNDVTVKAGVVTVNAMAIPQTVYVRATSIYDSSVYASAPINIISGKQFEIINIGVDSENENQLVRIYANKLTDYKDDVVFLMTFYDGNDKLVGAYSKKAKGKNLSQGENEIVIDYTLPEAYNKETGKAKLMAWTSLTTNEEPEGISGSFSASYANGTVTLSNVPSVSGTTTVAVFDSTNEAVYQAQSDTEVTTINVGTLDAGTYTLTLGGAVASGSYVTYKAEFTVN